jgi:lipopolysaccharide export system protein LptC
MSELADQQRTQRQIWASPSGRHDRMIAALRFLLPVAIGILFALLTFSPFSGNSERSFLLDKSKVNMATERLRVSEALYRGEDNKGRPFSLRAGSAVQKSSAEPIIRMSNIDGRMLLDEGPASVLAANGIYNLAEETVRVVGPLSLKSGEGYSVVANDVTLGLKDQIMQTPGQLSFNDGKGFTLLANNVSADLRTRRITSNGGVNGRTNVGTFSANRMTADMNTRIVTLTGNAHLRIDQNGIR